MGERPLLSPGTLRGFHRLWALDHALGPERVDRRWPGRRDRVAAAIDAELCQGDGPTLTPVERREDLDRETFLRDFVRQDRPVVLAGAAKGWAATNLWDLPWFIEHFPDVPVQLIHAAIGDRPEDRAGAERPLGEVLTDVLAGGTAYPRFVPLLQLAPQLRDSLDLPWLLSMRGPTGLGTNYQLFIGGPGTTTALHTAIGSNLFVQLHGRKRWWLLHPDASAALQPALTRAPYFFSEVDLEHPDTERFPRLRGVRGLTAELEPGDVLYNPPFYWHQVRNPTHSVGVGFRFYDPAALLRLSPTLTGLTLGATSPPIWTGIRLRGDFSRIFTS